MEKELRNKVASILKTVTRQSYPRIFDAIQVETGYKNIENQMIKMAINEGMSLEATLYHIERQ